MRIDPNARVGAAAARGTRRAAGGDGFARSLDSEPALPAAQVSAASVVDGLLAFQEVEDATAGPRRRAWRRGQLLLDRLDELKLGLLRGSISGERLAQLAQLARAGRALTDDPGLDEVLGEIELRAAVELAKLRRGD